MKDASALINATSASQNQAKKGGDMKDVGLVLITVFFVSLAWMIYVNLLGKDVRAAAQDAKKQLDDALERARAAEGVANVLHAKVLRAEAALNSETDLASAAQAARIILFGSSEPRSQTKAQVSAQSPGQHSTV